MFNRSTPTRPLDVAAADILGGLAEVLEALEGMARGLAESAELCQRFAASRRPLTAKDREDLAQMARTYRQGAEVLLPGVRHVLGLVGQSVETDLVEPLRGAVSHADPEGIRTRGAAVAFNPGAPTQRKSSN